MASTPKGATISLASMSLPQGLCVEAFFMSEFLAAGGVLEDLLKP